MTTRLPPPIRAGLLAAACLGGGAILWYSRSSPAPSSAPAADAAPSADRAPGDLRLTPTQWQSLEIRPVGMAAFRTLTVADGVVAVDDDATVPVFSPANGKVLSVDAKAGQSVRAGQTLAVIVGAETAQAGADLAAAAAAARSARKQLELARATVARQKGVVDAGGGATKDFLQSQSDLVTAEGAAQTADAAEAAALAKARAVGVASAAASGAAEATRLAAPISGEVIQRQIASGELVASLASGATTPLFTVSDLHRVWIVASVSDSDARRVKVGQPVEVTTSDGGGESMSGTLAWVAPAVDPTSRRLPVRVELPNPTLALRPQMGVRVRVLDPRSDKVPAVPNSALVFDGPDAHCFVESGVHTVAVRPLKIGRSEDGFTEVLSGLQSGDRVVVRGALFVDTADAGAAP